MQRFGFDKSVAIADRDIPAEMTLLRDAEPV
jgi:hypothetical protein